MVLLVVHIRGVSGANDDGASGASGAVVGGASSVVVGGASSAVDGDGVNRGVIMVVKVVALVLLMCAGGASGVSIGAVNGSGAHGGEKFDTRRRSRLWGRLLLHQVGFEPRQKS
jgi:hypothetical protein